MLKKKQDIIIWLDKYEVKKYNLRKDPHYGFIVDVGGGVNLSNLNLSDIPVKFGKVKGFFDCSNNELTHLSFAPHCVEHHFNCGNNNLTTLMGGPQSVIGNYFCYRNNLTNLIGSPQATQGNFSCHTNRIESLEGLGFVGQGIFLSMNKLKSLQGLPRIINGVLSCNNNELQTLEGVPESIQFDLLLSNNNLDKKALLPLLDCRIGEKIGLDNNIKLGDYQTVTSLGELKIIIEKDKLLFAIQESNVKKCVNKI